MVRTNSSDDMVYTSSENPIPRQPSSSGIGSRHSKSVSGGCFNPGMAELSLPELEGYRPLEEVVVEGAPAVVGSRGVATFECRLVISILTPTKHESPYSPQR